MDLSRRRLPLLAAALLAAATALVGPASPAQAAPTPTATIGDVTCADTDGTLTVDVQAGDADAATFTVFVDGSPYGDDAVIAAGASGQVVVTGLEDGDHLVEVYAFVGDAEADNLATANPTVACDVSPGEPYTNVKGEVWDGCEYTGVVSASNKAIAGDTDNLQPVEFSVAFTPTDDPADQPSDDTDSGSDGGTDPAPDPEPLPRSSTVGVEEVVASFTLDAANQTFDSTFELGTTGDLVLRAGETVVASAHIGNCQVVATPSAPEGGEPIPTLVNSGF